MLLMDVREIGVVLRSIMGTTVGRRNSATKYLSAHRCCGSGGHSINKVLLFFVVFLVGVAFSVFVQLLPEILRILPASLPTVPVRLNAASSVPWRQHLLVHDVELARREGGLHLTTLESSGLSVGIHLARDVPNTGLESEAMASLRLAVEMRNNGKDDKAMKLLQHAYALSPKHPDVLNQYGEFLEENENDLVQAEHLYARALLCSPQHSRALTNRKRTLPQVEELDELHLERIDAKRDLLITVPDGDASLRRIKKEAYFQHIYHSVGLEGNTMSLAETRHVVETRLAIGGKSVLEHNEILGLDAALAFINSSLVYKVGSLDVSDVLEIHRRVMGFADPLDAGQLRRTQVFVGDHVPPHPSEVAILLVEFVDWLNSPDALALHPVRYAALAHYKLVFIHPFTDGNGRTSRLLMNLFLMRAGFPPVIIRKQDRLRYYEHLKTANEGDIRPFVRFIAECTERTLDVYIYATTEYPIRAALEDQTDSWSRSRTIVV